MASLCYHTSSTASHQTSASSCFLSMQTDPTNTPEEQEIVKKIVINNETRLRKSMMVKKDSQTPKSVKERKEKKSKIPFWNRHSKAKHEEVPEPQPETPYEDPLHPDWSSDAPCVVSSNRSTPTTVTVAPIFKHSHTFAAEPVHTAWEISRDEKHVSESHISYRNEEDKAIEWVEESVNIKSWENTQEKQLEMPPVLPSRSTSRQVREGMGTVKKIRYFVRKKAFFVVTSSSQQ
uniref:Uncharacterized protein n=3 Tax=Caenorhabditis japonica TaxID=281687 RepID=A0A8R1ETN3_CAEJA